MLISPSNNVLCLLGSASPLAVCMPLPLTFPPLPSTSYLLPAASCLLPRVRLPLACSFIYDVGARVHERCRGADDGRVRLEQRADELPRQGKLSCTAAW